MANIAAGPSACAHVAACVLKHMQTALCASSRPAIRELGLALGTADPIAAVHAMEADFSVPVDETEQLGDLPIGTRVALWPRGWRSTACIVTAGLQELFASQELWNAGLVSTTLHYAQSAADAVAGKRSRSDMEQNDEWGGNAPPPVRGGRGRMREDNPIQRSKPSTARPASKHVDEYPLPVGPPVSQLSAPKRFQNSSRAPSKHVDDYQQAPVVRKTVPVESKPTCEGAAPPASGWSGEADNGGGPRLPGARNNNGGGGAGPNIVGQMSMQMLQQQLGMAAAQGMRRTPALHAVLGQSYPPSPLSRPALWSHEYATATHWH